MVAGDGSSMLAVVTRFATYVGVQVRTHEPGRAVADLQARPEMMNSYGGHQAGALFTVAEAASGALMMEHLGPRFADLFAVVRHVRVNYLRMARGDVAAVASLRDDGARLPALLGPADRYEIAVEVEVSDASAPVARMTFEWQVRGRQSGA